MSKRRNKNKKAGPVKLIKPGEPVAQDVQDRAGEQFPLEGDTTEALASQVPAYMEATDGFATDAGDIKTVHASHEPQRDEPQQDEPQRDEPQQHEPQQDEPQQDEPQQDEPQQDEPRQDEPRPEPWQQESEFGDVSAALAETLLDEPVVMPSATPIESIQIHDPQVMTSDDIAHAGAHAWDAMAAAPSDQPATDASSASDIQPTADFGSTDKRRKPDRKLKLNKLQKHARAETPPEPEAISAEALVEPVTAPAPKPPREPRIAAFAKLTEYQSLSLAHVPGLPEETDVPGHWRGVGFGLGGRRLVSAFDEVVEIMRMPQITHVPGTQTWMLGVANVRGTLLPVVDLKQFLEGERTVMHEGQRVLVVRQGGGNVAVLIDQLFGQRSFNDSQKTTVADTESRYGHFIKQMYRVDDNDWGVFSMSMLTRTPEFRQAAA